MSTSETDDFEIGFCPCGNGKIIKSVTTQDNPWSSADINHSIDCSLCARDWYIQHKQLVNRESEAPHIVSKTDEASIHGQLLNLTDSLVDSYFEKYAARNKKIEHAEMVRLGIYSDSYKAFLKAKAKAKKHSDIRSALGNLDWLGEQAKQAGVYEIFCNLIVEYNAAKHKTFELCRQIIRKNLPD